MKWISVEESLPEFNKEVLTVYFPVHPVMEGRLLGIKKRIEDNGHLERYLDDNGFPTGTVTHWMHLPERPE